MPDWSSGKGGSNSSRTSSFLFNCLYIISIIISIMIEINNYFQNNYCLKLLLIGVDLEQIS